ncbi:hypothetical protein CC86DRAFT_385793 [Ophiobolus disseminans]|uniref:Uncharacterized protein n=1 Tax=Ophiobolus disseminans TaxID=1469910 RepID=A0A6A6ZPB2_9PLEO|nr:hypothetical protein CC86DRAFT_385793 [Ophiobolus disseminans]
MENAPQLGRTALDMGAATRWSRCLIYVAHHRYMDQLACGGHAVCLDSSYYPKAHRLLPEVGAADWHADVSVRTDLQTPAASKHGLEMRICAELAECACQLMPPVTSVINSIACVLQMLSLANDAWPDGTAAWCRVGDVLSACSGSRVTHCRCCDIRPRCGRCDWGPPCSNGNPTSSSEAFHTSVPVPKPAPVSRQYLVGSSLAGNRRAGPCHRLALQLRRAEWRGAQGWPGAPWSGRGSVEGRWRRDRDFASLPHCSQGPPLFAGTRGYLPRLGPGVTRRCRPLYKGEERPG